MKHAVSVKFHNPLEHPEQVFNKTTKESEPTGKKVSHVIRFSIQTNEDGSCMDFEVQPGEEIDVPGEWAYAIPSLAPQLKEGPALRTPAGVPQAKK